MEIEGRLVTEAQNRPAAWRRSSCTETPEAAEAGPPRLMWRRAPASQVLVLPTPRSVPEVDLPGSPGGREGGEKEG